jgi:hypothetical protein
VSDGSYKDQYGTSVWAIEAESSVVRCTGVAIPPAAASKENRCKGVNIVPGARTDQSAYCSEVAGLFGNATMVRELCAFQEPWEIWLKDKKICMNLHSTLHNATCGQASLAYWEKRGKFGHGTHSDIDWKATGKAMAKVTISRRHWVAKHSSGFCGTSKMMLLWKKRATDTCPRCLQEGEDATHVWQCQDPRALDVWTQYIAKLEIWMQKQRTQKGIIQVICAKLLAWQRGSTEEIPVGTVHALPAVVQK